MSEARDRAGGAQILENPLHPEVRVTVQTLHRIIDEMRLLLLLLPAAADLWLSLEMGRISVKMTGTGQLRP